MIAFSNFIEIAIEPGSLEKNLTRDVIWTNQKHVFIVVLILTENYNVKTKFCLKIDAIIGPLVKMKP